MSESELEAELRALQPARPSLNLETAIARELAAEPRAIAVRPTAGVIVRPKARAGLWRSVGWLLAGAAAVVAVLAVPAAWRGRQAFAPSVTVPVQTAETAYFEPVSSAREVISADQSDVIYDTEDGPAQIVRYSTVERQSWSNPATGALVELEIPREEVFLVSVSYQ